MKMTKHLKAALRMYQRDFGVAPDVAKNDDLYLLCAITHYFAAMELACETRIAFVVHDPTTLKALRKANQDMLYTTYRGKVSLT